MEREQALVLVAVLAAAIFMVRRAWKVLRAMKTEPDADPPTCPETCDGCPSAAGRLNHHAPESDSERSDEKGV